jgi:hypothetical protein
VTQLTPILSCVLPQRLDSAAVSQLRGDLALHPWARAILLDAARVTGIDPVGALRLWDFCSEHQARGLRVELLHLSPELALQLRVHPLLEFASSEDQLFRDPFASLEGSTR